jgi:hypothetical protein
LLFGDSASPLRLAGVGLGMLGLKLTGGAH